MPLLGSGAADHQVDVLGHLLGFGAGLALGWVFARQSIPRSRGAAVQWLAGGVAILLVGTAWVLALGTVR